MSIIWIVLLVIFLLAPIGIPLWMMYMHKKYYGDIGYEEMRLK